MDDPKYLATMYGLLIFSQSFTHQEMSDNLNLKPSDIDGAGFVSMTTEGKFRCYGGSSSLKVASRPDEDSYLVQRLFERGF